VSYLSGCYTVLDEGYQHPTEFSSKIFFQPIYNPDKDTFLDRTFPLVVN
jgi:hypothetical protein